jgi:hypothetical protein
VVLLLVILPVWLALSGGFAVWHFLRRGDDMAAAEPPHFARGVSETLLADDLRKLVEVIGERHASGQNAAKNLTRAASMIEGLLGPANTGYTVRRVPGPAAWPILHATLRGTNPAAPAVWVLASYDSRPGSPGVEANATGLAATLAAAQAMADDPLAASVHFVFLPHANDPDSPVVETAAKFKELAGTAKAVLCVEAMGAGEELWLSSRDSAATPLAEIAGLGSVRGAEVVCHGEDADCASVLFEMGLPAVRVATRPIVLAEESDGQIPPSATLAASAGRLVELIRRCAEAP